MKIVTGLILLAASMVLAAPAAANPDDEAAPVSGEIDAGEALLSVLEALRDESVESVGMVFGGLTDLWSQDGEKRDRILMSLLDYQLRGVNSRYLAEMISARGRAILPILRARLESEPTCEKEFAKECRGREQRDPLIEELIEAVNVGEVLCVDIDNCLVRSARSMVSPEFRRVLDFASKDDKPAGDMEEGSANAANGAVDDLAGEPKALTDLLDYDLGPAADALVDKQIARLGVDAVSELDRAYLAPLVCHPAYGAICIVDRGARKRRIERLTDAIKGGAATQ